MYRKRHRTTFSQYQLCVLEDAFRSNSYPSSKSREDIAAKTDLESSRVQVWFQNRRAKHKKQVSQAIRCFATNAAAAAAVAASAANNGCNQYQQHHNHNQHQQTLHNFQQQQQQYQHQHQHQHQHQQLQHQQQQQQQSLQLQQQQQQNFGPQRESVQENEANHLNQYTMNLPDQCGQLVGGLLAVDGQQQPQHQMASQHYDQHSSSSSCSYRTASGGGASCGALDSQLSGLVTAVPSDQLAGQSSQTSQQQQISNYGRSFFGLSSQVQQQHQLDQAELTLDRQLNMASAAVASGVQLDHMLIAAAARGVTAAAASVSMAGEAAAGAKIKLEVCCSPQAAVPKAYAEAARCLQQQQQSQQQQHPTSIYHQQRQQQDLKSGNHQQPVQANRQQASRQQQQPHQQQEASYHNYYKQVESSTRSASLDYAQY